MYECLLLPPQAQLTFLYLLRVIMPKPTGKPRGRPRKLEDDAKLQKRRERNRRAYWNKKECSLGEEEELGRNDQEASGAVHPGVMNGRPRSETDDETKLKKQERNKRYYEKKKERILKVKIPLVRNISFVGTLFVGTLFVYT